MKPKKSRLQEKDLPGIATEHLLKLALTEVQIAALAWDSEMTIRQREAALKRAAMYIQERIRRDAQLHLEI